MEFKIEHTEVYGLNKAIIASGNAMRVEMDDNTGEPTEKDLKRAYSLGSTGTGEGHDNFLNGIIVQFDLTCTNKMWVEMERYHFIDFVSSQSTMHRAAKMDFAKTFCPYVTARTMIECNRLKAAYQEDPSAENYLKLLYNLPSGMELTARMTTNYRQLKTIYRQRKDHRLPEWREFCRWLETLPHSEWITRKES